MIAFSRLVPLIAAVELDSSNQDARPRSVSAIRCVVLHATADRGNEGSAEAWMCHPSAGVSAHLHFRRDGTVVRLVPDFRRAWHAGRSSWEGAPNVNDFSLGWEIANRNDCAELYTDQQYAALARSAAHYLEQGLPLDAFVSHASVARPRGRKSDPCGFDWERFRREVRSEQVPRIRPSSASPIPPARL